MTRCPTHDVAQPCNGCLADHHAGEHLAQPQPDLCPRCETAPAEIDAVSRAAADDMFTETTSSRPAAWDSNTDTKG